MTASAASERTAALDATLATLHLEGHWKIEGDGLPSEPRTVAEPFVWRWSDIYPALIEAGEALGIEGDSRRTLRLCNPGLPGKTTTPTVHASVQMVKPGEVAGLHRHSPSALRFVVKGQGGRTTVNGQAFVMERCDLILTPAGTWHEHRNESDEPIIWVDGHDVPLVRALGTLFFEPATGGKTLPTASSYCGTPHIFKGSEMLSALVDSRGTVHSPWDGRVLELRDPVTGGPTLPTISCRLHRLASGEETHLRRQTASVIYYVVEGAGTTNAGTRALTWGPGDLFVVPNWTWASHAVTSDQAAILFSISDAPALEALGHLRAQTLENGKK